MHTPTVARVCEPRVELAMPEIWIVCKDLLRWSAVARHSNTKDAVDPVSNKALAWVDFPSNEDAIT